MAFGARVPGTSYQLDPVQAACNIGTMVGWLDCGDEALASDCGRLSDNLGAILAVADYRSRKAIAEGARPLTVRDLAATIVRAHEHASQEWKRSIRAAQAAMPPRAIPVTAGVMARCGLTRIASAAAAAALLGGSEDRRAAAIAFARRESAITPPNAVPSFDRHERWQLGMRPAVGCVSQSSRWPIGRPPFGPRWEAPKASSCPTTCRKSTRPGVLPADGFRRRDPRSRPFCGQCRHSFPAGPGRQDRRDVCGPSEARSLASQ